jgi:hypothetical protein
MTDERRDKEQGATRPQAPIVTIARQGRFLDVQPSVTDAESHLARHQEEEEPSHQSLPTTLPLDACDYYDGVARPSQPVVHDDGTASLELAPGAPQPERLRARVNQLLLWALESYDLASLVEMSAAGKSEGELDERELKRLLTPPADESFPRFLDELDQRFNPWANHLAGRLHNLWHALGG